MNDTTASASPERRDDREEIARLLPAPAERDLPREGHLRHKELLMRQIDRDRAASARPSRRLLRPALLVPVTALALAGVLAGGFALEGGDREAVAGTAPGTATDMRPVAALLREISGAAGRKAAPVVRDDQFVYTREKVREVDLTSGKAVVSPLKDYEKWIAQEPGPLKRLGLIRSDGETFPLNAELGDTNGTPAGFSRPTYQWLSSLPTDPAKLLDYLYARTPRVDRRERDQAVFEQIGELLGGVMPPRTAAALYEAAARIPGVTRTPQAWDAIGRPGIGIARDDERNGVHTEWVFDRKDLSFLGYRSYLIKDAPYGRAGTLLSSTAQIRTAVVDKAGEEPPGTAGTRDDHTG
ncbi:CU044_5270 family protein [Streptomyces naganishii]|uniref:CU044_5270 family protein n=1 Tax=Streptomyces naganishii TaxID=285447 RepID=UPI00368B943A